MPFQPIKIPQNVQIEDHIVGPLTLRQIIIIGIGCGISYAMWASVSKAYGYVGVPLTIVLWIPGVVSALFAFVKINDLSMLRLCLLAAEQFSKPSTRLWTPRTGLSINIRTFRTPAEDRKKKWNRAEHPDASNQIEAISSVLDGVMRQEPTTAVATAVASPVEADRISVSPAPADAKGIDGIEVRPAVSLLPPSPR